MAAGNNWRDTIRSNWTLRSIATQHTSRVAIVGALDALVMDILKVNHGFWLAMTSLIVLQPNFGHTLQRSLQRARGTLAGGVLASLLAASLQWPPLLIAVVTLGRADLRVLCDRLHMVLLLSNPNLRPHESSTGA
jgi:uncharacterized membrane protein YccC